MWVGLHFNGSSLKIATGTLENNQFGMHEIMLQVLYMYITEDYILHLRFVFRGKEDKLPVK